MRVRAMLRGLGVREKIDYKTDADTLAGKYRRTGYKDKDIVKYQE